MRVYQFRHIRWPRKCSRRIPSSLVSTQPLRELLEQAFPDATELDVVDRTGGGDHFQVVVAAPSLGGLSLVEQHRRVYEALATPLADGTIHELRIKTKGT